MLHWVDLINFFLRVGSVGRGGITTWSVTGFRGRGRLARGGDSFVLIHLLNLLVFLDDWLTLGLFDSFVFESKGSLQGFLELVFIRHLVHLTVFSPELAMTMTVASSTMASATV